MKLFTNFKPPGLYKSEWNLVIERTLEVSSLGNKFWNKDVQIHAINCALYKD